VIALLFELLFNVLVEIGFEWIFERFDFLDEGESGRTRAVVFFMVVGAAVGAATVLVRPERVLRAGPFGGVSLLVVPALLGGFMELWGALLGRRGRSTSHLATWYGGSAMGFGLAAGRLAMMPFGRSE
jgi:hypothetical protein